MRFVVWGLLAFKYQGAHHKGHQVGFHGSSPSFVISICNIDSIQILIVSLLNEKKLNIGSASIVRKLVFGCNAKGGHAVYSDCLSSNFLPSKTSVPLILLHLCPINDLQCSHSIALGTNGAT